MEIKKSAGCIGRQNGPISLPSIEECPSAGPKKARKGT
jgi:hypothetical protein